MKNIFFLFTMLALTHFANAQNVTIDSLANRVEVLEQQLAYERLSKSIEKIRFECELKSLKWDSDRNLMLVNILHNGAENRMYNAYKSSYDVAKLFIDKWKNELLVIDYTLQQRNDLSESDKNSLKNLISQAENDVERLNSELEMTLKFLEEYKKAVNKSNR